MIFIRFLHRNFVYHFDVSFLIDDIHKIDDIHRFFLYRNSVYWFGVSFLITNSKYKLCVSVRYCIPHSTLKQNETQFISFLFLSSDPSYVARNYVYVFDVSFLTSTHTLYIS